MLYNEQLIQLISQIQKAFDFCSFKDLMWQLDKGSQDTNNETVTHRPVDLEDTFMLEVVSVIN